MYQLYSLLLQKQNIKLQFFESLFVLANGPVLVAIIVWRNSMVFHSVDKMTSLFIHVFPPMYTFIQRWELSTMEMNSNSILSITNWFVYPTILYLLWQFGYLIKTEFIDAEFLSSNPKIATSLRWLSSDDKNFFTKQTVKYCRKIGIMSKDEKFDSSQWKTKFIFIFVNLAYFLATICYVKLTFENKYIHITCMFITLLSSIFNGANYYIEIFSERYNETLKQKQAKLEKKYTTIEERLDEILKQKFQEIERQFDANNDISKKEGSADSVASNVSDISDIASDTSERGKAVAVTAKEKS